MQVRWCSSRRLVLDSRSKILARHSSLTEIVTSYEWSQLMCILVRRVTHLYEAHCCLNSMLQTKGAPSTAKPHKFNYIGLHLPVRSSASSVINISGLLLEDDSLTSPTGGRDKSPRSPVLLVPYHRIRSYRQFPSNLWWQFLVESTHPALPPLQFQRQTPPNRIWILPPGTVIRKFFPICNSLKLYPMLCGADLESHVGLIWGPMGVVSKTT